MSGQHWGAAAASLKAPHNRQAWHGRRVQDTLQAWREDNPMMRKEVPAESPRVYVEALDGWRREIVEA